MFPDLTLRLYPVVVVAAVLIGAAVSAYSARRARIPLGRFALFQCGLACAGLLGGRLYELLELEGGWTWRDLFGLGFRHPGAIGAVLVTLPPLRRVLFPEVPLGRLADCVAASTSLAMAVFRVGCFGIGCCFGIPTDLPWAITFPPNSLPSQIQAKIGLLSSSGLPSVPVHPLQVYLFVLSLGVGLWLLWFQRREHYDGQVFLAFLAIHESGKFALEWLRQPLTLSAGPAWVPWISLLLAAGAAATLWYRAEGQMVSDAEGTFPVAGPSRRET